MVEAVKAIKARCKDKSEKVSRRACVIAMGYVNGFMCVLVPAGLARGTLGPRL